MLLFCLDLHPFAQTCTNPYIEWIRREKAHTAHFTIDVEQEEKVEVCHLCHDTTAVVAFISNGAETAYTEGDMEKEGGCENGQEDTC